MTRPETGAGHRGSNPLQVANKTKGLPCRRTQWVSLRQTTLDRPTSPSLTGSVHLSLVGTSLVPTITITHPPTLRPDGSKQTLTITGKKTGKYGALGNPS